MSLSLEVKIRSVILYAQLQSPVAVWRALAREGFKDRPSEQSIKNIYSKFCETGSVENKSKASKQKIYDQDMIDEVQDMINENPKISLKDIGQQIGVSKSTAFKIVKEELNMKSYKIQMHQQLYEDDPDRRLEFAEIFLPMLNNKQYENLIFFSDEATFHVSGYVHKQNCRIWGQENPHSFQEYEMNSPKINVWCAISEDCIIGPYFFEGETINGQNYLNMLETFFIPQLKKEKKFNKALFQQDGAPAHYTQVVREFLNANFSNRWIGRRGPIEWPPRSPDLSPLDFFFWGYIKQKVYSGIINDIGQLRERITNVIEEFDFDFLETSFQNLRKRLDLIIQQEGRHIEQLL